MMVSWVKRSAGSSDAADERRARTSRNAPPAATSTTRTPAAMLHVAAARDTSAVRPTRGDQLLELEPRVADVVQPVVRLLAEAAREQPLQRVGSAARQRRPVGLARADRVGEIEEGAAGEGMPPGEHLVQQAAERPDVGAAVHRLTEELLGAHVLRRADDRSRSG